MYEGSEAFWRFLFPKFDRKLLLRLVLLATAAFLVFRFALMPCFIHGGSMEPTYSRIGLNLCNRLYYRLHKLRHGDVAVIHYHDRTYLLKRIVALAGDTVEIRGGVLFLNGEAVDEPYVKYNAGWNLPPRKVAPGDCYVIGDNRGMPMEEHKFGSIGVNRIAGSLVW